MDETLTPLQRFLLAFIAFFKVLFDARFAEEVHRVQERLAAGPTTAPSPPAPATPPTTAPPTGTAARTAPSTPPSLPPAPTTAPPPKASPAVAAPAPVPSPAPPAKPAPPAHAESLHLLAILQRDGRLLDFLEESLEGFSDSEIGAAARTVHAGCKKALGAYVELEPVYRDPEGASVTVAPGFDPAAVRLTGNVVGAPPFRGALRHHGWRAGRTSFPPPPAQDVRILAPAEVEL